jgi:predicted transcriptional regulator
MDKPVTRKDVRAQVRAARKTAQLAREALERANVGDLTEVQFRQAQLADVDNWVQTQIDRVSQAAEKRRDQHKIAISKALHAMRLRGESMRGIAEQSGLTERQIRDYMKLTTGGSGESAKPSADNAVDVDNNHHADPTGVKTQPGPGTQPITGNAAR